MKNIKEVNDFCDYVVINMGEDKRKSGIRQYYEREEAMGKMFEKVVETRNQEIGRLAAYEYE
jgi:hypothetical protein